MSDSILRIIPSAPAFVPGVAAQHTAASHLRAAFPQATNVEIRVEEEVIFIDAGENFEAVYCPRCKSELEIPWWGDAMSRAAASGFSDLDVELPCCGASGSLNDLRYEFAQGFAQFVIDVWNPNVVDIPANLEAQLRDILGCGIRFIWSRY